MNHHSHHGLSQHEGKRSVDFDDETSLLPTSHKKQPHRPQAYKSLHSQLISTAYGTLTLLSIGLNAIFLYSSLRTIPLSLAEEPHGLVPSFPLTYVTFTNQSDYVPLYDSSVTYEESLAMVKQKWRPLFPDGNGFIHVDNPGKYHLGPPMVLPVFNETSLYGITVYHQLHCVYHLLRIFMAYAHNRTHEPELDSLLKHGPHCFDYLRQSIMCYGDTALDHRDGDSGTLGLGVVHVCKDWSALQEYSRKEFDKVFDDEVWYREEFFGNADPGL